QGIIGNHGALRRPDAAEHEARHVARRVASGLPAPETVRQQGRPGARTSSPLGAGAPLPAAIRAYLERSLGADFSTVRVHIGGLAAETTRAARARAVTLGEHIAFAAGAYRPDSSEGRLLLAHELTHVIQQRST